MKPRSVLNFFTIFALLLSILGSTLTVTPVYAASFSVGDAASLIAAINTANANGVDDTITLTASIVLNVPNNVGMSGPNGLPVITAVGESLIIEGDGYTISRAGGSPDFRFFENQRNLTLNNITLSNGSTVSGGAIFNSGAGTLTITNSTLSGNTSSSNGGGIYNSGTLTVTNSILSGNSATGNGGGIYNFAGTLNVTNSTFSANVAYQTGGGISAIAGTVTVTNSTFSGNSANGVGLGAGGGIANAGATLNVTGTTFSGNSAEASGGGLANQSGTATITGSTFSGNSSAGGPSTSGGGFVNYDMAVIANSTFSGNSSSSSFNCATGGGGANSGTLTITNSTFVGNSVSFSGTGPGPCGATDISHGGGLYNSGSLNLSNTTLANNSAAYGGGTYIAYPGTTLIENSTLSGNNATINGSAIAIQLVACAGPNVEFRSTTIAGGTSGASVIYAEPLICVPGSLTMSNTIVARNSETNAFELNNGVSFIDNGNNITNDNGVNTPVGITYHASLGLGSLTNNGGPTETIALLTGSPAIDAGANCLSTDQRGVSRPQGNQCDIGAYEKLDDSGFPTFADVPTNAFAWSQIESIYFAGITGGCSVLPLNYCPNQPVTRAQMAVFIVRGIHGSSYTPPPATGTVFNDVPASHWAAAWVEQFFAEGITAGCGNGNFCPDQVETTRAQIAVFLLKAKYGIGYTPPPATGTMFNDVPSDGFAAAWIEQLANEGITGGCGNGNYCPNGSVTRAQMAVFLQKTFNLPLP